MIKRSLLGLIFVATVGLAFPANAVTFTLSNVNISLHDSEPPDGLTVLYDNVVSTPHNENLNVGGSSTFNLFRIYTNECCLNADDFTPFPINVQLTFSAPSNFNDTIGGTTFGGTIGIASGGVLSWNGPVDFLFGSGGILRIELSDEIFNANLGLNFRPGPTYGKYVEAKLTYIQAPSENGGVPEPATMLLIGAGLLGLGVYQRRRQQA